MRILASSITSLVFLFFYARNVQVVDVVAWLVNVAAHLTLQILACVFEDMR